MSDHEQLRELNQAYIRASLRSDVAWYGAALADDFVYVGPDGAVLDKPRFLAMIAAGSGQATYRLDDVQVRTWGDVALVRGVGAWTTHAGVDGTSHYTDLYVRQGGGWRCVSAQVTHPKPPQQAP
jgi:ketosteroid isomerase-like protein